MELQKLSAVSYTCTYHRAPKASIRYMEKHACKKILLHGKVEP